MPLSLAAPIAELRAAHQTDKYRTSLPIVRRGLRVRLRTRAQSLRISLKHAHPSDRHNVAYASFTVSVRAPASNFSLIYAGADVRELAISPTAPVGLYEISDGNDSLQLAVLFNPLVPGDDVYMQSDVERKEYVFNEEGLIWRGSADSNYPAAWDYGQFNPIVLLSAISFLDRMPMEKRGDAVTVSRHLSALVNHNDRDNGLLVGRWDGNYADGTPPTAWTGSVPLITEFWRSRVPVRYAQCWVYGAVLTSLCRTLGLPCRTISNFNSAHDTDRPYNRAVDLYFDTQGDMIEHRSVDSVWNFHVWNEGWMKRADLAADERRHGVSFDGWQVLDATPQERSMHKFQLGPAPLAAIKRGISLQYDTDFVIGEVNADVLFHWQRQGTSQFELRGKNTRHVGKVISTKSVWSDRRNDVTLKYKFAEGSPEEREALANRSSAGTRALPNSLSAGTRALPNNLSAGSRALHEPRALSNLNEVSFELSFPSRVKVGDSIVVTIRASNGGSTAAQVHFSSLYRATRYTGAAVARLGQDMEDVEMAAGTSSEFSVEVTAEQYMKHLANDVHTIKFTNSAKVKTSDQSWAEECIVRLYGDDALEVSAPSSIELNETARARLTVVNSFRMPLTDVTLRASGEGVLDATVIRMGTVEPGASEQAEIELDASAVGDHVLVVTLDTAELKDISKSVHVLVEDNSGSAPWDSFMAALRRRGDRNWDELLTIT